MLNIEKIIYDINPALKDKKHLTPFLIRFLKTILHEDKINAFIKDHGHLHGFAFLEKILEKFNFNYHIDASSIKRIPSEGRLLIVANHPIGSLDGLALLDMVHSVRPDVKVVANYILAKIEPLAPLFLQVDNLSEKAQHKATYQSIKDSLNLEQAVIIFPAGEVSRLRADGIRDGKWKTGFVKLARKTKSPILPIMIDGRNSAFFYSISMLLKPLSTVMLVDEMYRQINKNVRFFIGKPVSWNSVEQKYDNDTEIAKKFRKQVFKLKKKNYQSIYDTFETIIHPADSKQLKKEIEKSICLGSTPDGKKIYLFSYLTDSAVMREIGRLRELTFRMVEEGTGTPYDIDKYDTYYRHLILWDEKELEIVGAYRLGKGDEIMEKYGRNGFYTDSLFNYDQTMDEYLSNSIELGRSFVQPKYWGSRGLDYLWYGIGAFLNKNPDVKYLFGPVSLSRSYPQNAKELIVAFYEKQFGSDIKLARAKNPFSISLQVKQQADTDFAADYKSAYKKLSGMLNEMGVKIPVLYKQYSELCNEKGCAFIDFNIDPDFSDCIDGLIMVEISKISDKKRKRYIEQNALFELNS